MITADDGTSQAPVPGIHGVLFVCMGNICRSPTAEGVFRAAMTKERLDHVVRADSAGTHGYHAGEPPDRRATLAAKNRGYDIAALRARQIVREDFFRFDWILAMDLANLRTLEELQPAGYTGHLGLYLDLVPDIGLREMPDPYYGGTKGFEQVLDLTERVTPVLVARVVRTMRP